VGTDYTPDAPVVWVRVAGVQNSRRQWTYTLTEDNPGSSKNGTLRYRPTPTGKLCHSYAELCVWLYTYGCAPPPPDYFAPTHEEMDEGIESILRRVMRSRYYRPI